MRALTIAVLAGALTASAFGYFVLGGGVSIALNALPATNLLFAHLSEATPSSGSVCDVTDSSGNGNDLTETGAACPAVLTINGINTLYFQGAQDLIIPNSLSVDKRNMSLYMRSTYAVESISGSGDPQFVVASFGSSTGFTYAELGSNSTAPMDRVSVPWASNPALPMSWSWSVNGFVSSASALTYFRDADTSSYAAVASASLTGGTIGGSGSIGTPQRFVGAISDIAIYGPQSATDVALTRRFFSAHTPQGNWGKRRKLLITEGDSLTKGYRTDSTLDYPHRIAQTLGEEWRVLNFAWSGHTILQELSEDAVKIDPLYDATNDENILTLMIGINDLKVGGSTPATVYSNIVSWCQARRAVGWKVVLISILPGSNGSATVEADRQTVDTSEAANWQSFANAFVDVRNNQNIGTANANLGSYFNSDHLHMNNAGHGEMYNLVMPAIRSVM